MNWKGRQMFGGKPSGIVQMMGGGMTPYPSHTMPDGTVMRGAVHGQGYEEGGPVAPDEPSMNDRIAQIAAQQGISVPEARAQILQKTAADQGLTLPEEAIQSFAVGMINLNDALSQGVPIPAMQVGGLLIEENQFVDPSPSPNDQGLLTEETRELKDLYNNIITAMESTDMDFNTIIDSRVTQGSITKKAADDLKKVYAIQKMREMQNPPPMPKADNNFRDEPRNYARPMPVAPTDMNKMQVGGMVGAELFEEGDNDVNNALNMMASVSSPEVPEMPANNGMELASKKMVGEEMPMDQGLESLDPSLKKVPFQKMAINIVEQADELLSQEEYANSEEISAQVQEQLNTIDAQYRLQTNSQDTILTEEFLSVLDRITANSGTMSGEMPAYEHGGKVHADPALQQYIQSISGGTSADPEKMQEIIAKYRNKNAGSSEMLEKQIAKARRGALLGGKTKQSGLSGLFDVMGQADAAEVAALGNMPQQLSSNEAALERMALENELAMYGGSKGAGMTAEARNLLLLQRVIAMPDGPEKEMFLDKFNIDTEAKTIKEFVGDIAKDIGSKSPGEFNQWKRVNGFDGIEYDTYTTPQLAVEQAKRLAAAMSSSAANTEGTSTSKSKNGNPGV